MPIITSLLTLIHFDNFFKIFFHFISTMCFSVLKLSSIVLFFFVVIFQNVIRVDADTVLESNKHTDWGLWGQFQNCSAGQVVLAFQLKTEPYIGDDDDTALNGIRFFCGDPRNPDRFTNNLTSFVGEWGSWGQVYRCGFGGGQMNGFQLNVETYQGSGDDTATNNLRIKCTYHQYPEQFLQGDGRDFGIWREIHVCPNQEVICGLQTQLETYQGDDDDTALNNIRVKCCQI